MKMLTMPEISPLKLIQKLPITLRRLPWLIAAHITLQIIKKLPNYTKNMATDAGTYGENGCLHP
jgi:hypothetical protein